MVLTIHLYKIIPYQERYRYPYVYWDTDYILDKCRIFPFERNAFWSQVDILQSQLDPYSNGNSERGNGIGLLSA